jgi:hypothetical protein
MAVAINYYKCSPELYNKYLAAGKLVDTDFYFVEDKEKNIQELYMGKILLSSSDENIAAIREAYEKLNKQINELAPIAKSGLIEDLGMLWDTMLIFDGGSADAKLAVLDHTILK